MYLGNTRRIGILSTRSMTKRVTERPMAKFARKLNIVAMLPTRSVWLIK